MGTGVASLLYSPERGEGNNAPSGLHKEGGEEGKTKGAGGMEGPTVIRIPEG